MKNEEKKLEEKSIIKEKNCTCKKKPCKTKCTCKKKTTVSIRVTYDVGWGNTLFIRGEGEGINWDKGIPLTYDEKKAYWHWECKSEKPIEFKLLINDELWSDGNNFIAKPGKIEHIKPHFV